MTKKLPRALADSRSIACRVCGLSNALILRWNELQSDRRFRMRKREFRTCHGCGRYACNKCISWEGGYLRCRACLHFLIVKHITPPS